MNKITVKNLICSVVYGISLLLFVSGIMCIVNYTKLKRPANGLLLCFIFCLRITNNIAGHKLLVWLILKIISSSRAPSTMDVAR